MKITHIRKYFGAAYTMSDIIVDGKFFCHAIEDTDRGLTSQMTEEQIAAKKIPGKTAIPYGKYEITIDVVSPRFSQKAVYTPIRGKLPRLINVKGFDGVLVHIGNTEKDSAGCIIVGENRVKGCVSNSNATFFKLYAKMQGAKLQGQKITWEIVKNQ